jgi:membrane protease YdiL (CAAX protease family)
MTTLPEVLPPDAIGVPEPVTIRPPRFGAGLAFLSYILLVMAQFVAGVVVMIGAIVVALARGESIEDATFIQRVMEQATAPLLLVAGIVSALAIYACVRLFAWHLVRDKSADGLGLTRARTGQIAFWTLVGFATAGAYIAVYVWVIPFDPATPVGPLAKAAAAGGASRLAWAFLALAFAPFFEELFFRGLLLRGFTASWGNSAAAIVVTLLFLSLHLGDVIAYWPAMVAIVTISIFAIIARRTSGSLVPAMAMHGAYNSVFVIGVYTAALT